MDEAAMKHLLDGVKNELIAQITNTKEDLRNRITSTKVDLRNEIYAAIKTEVKEIGKKADNNSKEIKDLH